MKHESGFTTDDADRTALEAQRLAERSAQALFAGDQASKSLGIELVEIRPGYAILHMRVRADMLNGKGTCHGGIMFSLADSAFAAACNTYNVMTVAAAASVDFLAPVYERDMLSAVAHEVWRSTRNGIYEVLVSNQRGEHVALFRGRSYQLRGEIVARVGQT